jgi:6-pyruvoyltetrahydropterin/6-carboxytetrahydropterin synthase
MYSVSVRRDFIAQHHLIGGDWGPENELHSHHYVVEVALEGETLNTHGYLVDIDDVFATLDAQVEYFKDKILNTLPEFKAANPSLEHLARILCQAVARQLKDQHVSAVTVRVWENELAWAGYRKNV